jgi:hypothetical protein
MYYILSSSNDVKIPNIEFKKELLKGIIEEISMVYLPPRFNYYTNGLKRQ